MKISRTIAYALHATLRLGRAESRVPVPCSRLAGEGQMPERFLLQILRSLVTHGVLKSTRGVDGGYCLARTPDEITLCDIVDAFENPLEPVLPELEGLQQTVRDELMITLRSVSCAARRELDKVSLADLLNANGDESGNGQSNLQPVPWRET